MSDPLSPPPARARLRLTGASREDGLTNIAVAAFVIAALWLGRPIFVPIAIAVLLSFVLAPAVLRLRAWHAPRGLAVFLVVLVAFAFILGIGTIIGRQVSDLASDLPRYQVTIAQKAEALRHAATASTLIERASQALHSLGDPLSPRKTPQRSSAPNADGTAPEPVPVEVHQPAPGPFDLMRSFAATIFEPLANVGVVAIFTVFILMQREDLRDRLIRLLSGGDLHRTTLALDDAAARLSRFFLVQTALNLTFGIVIGIGLSLIGVPSPVLWGLFSALMRFVPYIGALASGLGPVALAAAVDPGWSMVLMTIALFLVLEPLTGQIIEPLLYGHSTGLSPIAVVMAATFWTWLWGPIGLLLSMPLTVCLVVLGEHVERLSFLNVILSDTPALTPRESFYQRLLADDPSEAADQAQEFLKTHQLTAFYDEIALPSLMLAQADLRKGFLLDEQQSAIRDTLCEVIEDLEETYVKTDAAPKKPDDISNETNILCLAARTALDEAAATMLAQCLQKSGLSAQVSGADVLAPGRITRLPSHGVSLICLSAFDAEGSAAHLRYATRRLRRRCPQAKLVACFWLPPETSTSITALAKDAGADFQASHMAAAIETCRHALQRQVDEAARQAVA